MSKKITHIGIVSDTHAVVDDRIVDALEHCDVIVHAGDIGGAGVLRGLAARGREVVAVRGNNDVRSKWPEADASVLEHLPHEATLELPGGMLAVVHGDRLARPHIRHDRLRAQYPQARLIVYGHSHSLTFDQEATPWVVNPGAAGKTLTRGGPSCILMQASAKAWRLELLRFPPASAGRRSA